MAAERGLPSYAASGCQGSGYRRIELPRRRAHRLRLLVRPPQLTQDLVLPHDLRVEPGRHPEEVIHRRQAVPPIDRASVEHDTLLAGEAEQARVLVVVTPPAELQAIARREHHQRPLRAKFALEPGRDLVRCQCQLLTDGDGRRVVADTDDVKGEWSEHARTLPYARQKGQSGMRGG